MSKVYFYYSAMNAGKSTVLLQASHNYHERGMRTLLFTPAIDNRAGTGRIKSRIGLEADALALQVGRRSFRARQGRARRRATDRLRADRRGAAFLTRTQVEQCTDIADRLGVPVMCFGLRTDFQAQLFPRQRGAASPSRTT